MYVLVLSLYKKINPIVCGEQTSVLARWCTGKGACKPSLSKSITRPSILLEQRQSTGVKMGGNMKFNYLFFKTELTKEKNSQAYVRLFFSFNG